MTFRRKAIQPRSLPHHHHVRQVGALLALSAILNPGDEVLYLEPVWVSYPPMIVLAGGTPVAVTLSADDNFAFHSLVYYHAPCCGKREYCSVFQTRPRLLKRRGNDSWSENGNAKFS